MKVPATHKLTLLEIKLLEAVQALLNQKRLVVASSTEGDWVLYRRKK